MQEKKTKCHLIDEMVRLTITLTPISALGSAHVEIQQEVVCSHDCVCERYGWEGCKAKEQQMLFSELA